MSGYTSMATELKGNTVAFSSSKARAYQLTLNKVERYEELRDALLSLKSLDYYISCKEKAPTTGHEHIHIYAHFNTPYRMSQKILKIGAHIEICKGSPKQNVDYIRKDGNIIEEFGEEPHQGRIYTVKEVREAPVDDIPASLKRIRKEMDEEEREKKMFMDMLTEIENDNLKAPKIIYITGSTGKGKTYGAYKRAIKEYKKEEIGKLTLKNDFIDIENKDAKCFVIEEFRSSQIMAADFLQLTDKYGYKCNTKGGFYALRPEMIIICSIIHPRDLYANEEINEQFLRRITELIDLDKSLKKNTDEED
uniref:Replication-associated protein n=1 Tax=Syrmaticus ellioti CRESS-DNA-virus sp. TaxID=2815058 RepID=A0A8A4XBD8_9VIRU|nr:MAG: replication-associated protein [Syrmaticus ellioti CRESS-DNA-virus sp.]